MSWIRRLLNLTRSDALSRDIDREIEFHVAERTDDLVAAGLSEAEARWQAKRRFGNYGSHKERTRDTDLVPGLEALILDLRHAVRGLRASPAFALVAILSLGLGIGANTAIFSLINSVMLKSLPVSHPEELVAVTLGPTDTRGIFSNPLWEQVRDRQTAFAGMFASHNDGFNLTTGGEARFVGGNQVSGDYFSTLGVRPVVGRLITRADDYRGCPNVAVLSYGFWQREYAGDPGIVGRSITLNGKPFQVLGVTDPRFYGIDVGRSIQVYAPLCAVGRDFLERRSTWSLRVLGRMKLDRTPDQVRADLRALAPVAYAATLPANWGAAEQKEYLARSFDIRLAPGGLSQLRNQYGKPLYALMAVVGIVLLIACANVANLLLARATVRQREIAIRLAIGASRARLVQQLLTESVLLSFLGAAVGVLFARWGTALLVALLSTGETRVTLDLSVDWRLLAFTIGVATLTGLLFGLAPAWRSAKVDPQTAMKAGGRGVVDTAGRGRFPLGKALVVVQIGLSLLLVVTAGLLVGTLGRLTSLDAGFRRDHVLIAFVNATRTNLPAERVRGIVDEGLAKLAAVPGVKRAAAAAVTPISGSSWNDMIVLDGFKPAKMEDAVFFGNQVTPDYFETLGTSLLAGRGFTRFDLPGARRVAIVNETMAKKFFGGHPLGKVYYTMNGDTKSPPYEIIGVVRDAKYQSLREDMIPTAYLAMSQDTSPNAYVNFVIHFDGNLPSVKAGVAQTFAGIDREITLSFSTLEEDIAHSLTQERLLATLSGFFGGLALLLAMIGLYGVVSYNVTRRRGEIGIRLALGAAAGQVQRMVLGEVGRLVAVGVVIGIVAALVATRIIATFLYGVTAADPLTMGISVVVLICVAIAAGAVPARRASRLDPMVALREE